MVPSKPNGLAWCSLILACIYLKSPSKSSDLVVTSLLLFNQCVNDNEQRMRYKEYYNCLLEKRNKKNVIVFMDQASLVAYNSLR